MRINEIIPKKYLKKLPVSATYFNPIDKSNHINIGKYVKIKSYQSLACECIQNRKPISKII